MIFADMNPLLLTYVHAYRQYSIILNIDQLDMHVSSEVSRNLVVKFKRAFFSFLFSLAPWK